MRQKLNPWNIQQWKRLIVYRYGDGRCGFHDTPKHLNDDWSLPSPPVPFPTHTRVIICGAGLVANSVAYHLLHKHGWTDVILLEQQRIGSGTSLYGSGTLSLLRPLAERSLVSQSLELFHELQEQGIDVGLKVCGSLNLAQTKSRMVSLRRSVAMNKPTGLNCQVLSPSEVKLMHPYLQTADLEGAVFVPDDAVADPRAVCNALAKLNRQGGVQILEGVQVQEILTTNDRITGVKTNFGNIACEYFVNCAGMWAWEIGQQESAKVRIPVHPAEHFYLTTHALVDPPSLTKPLPILQDFDSHIYIRKWRDGYMVGGFEPEARPAFCGRNIPFNWREELKPDWDHFRPFLEKALHRLPLLQDAEYNKLTNAPDNFTPDGKWVLGETPEIDNYFVAVGMNGNSLQGAGGIGNAVAEWIVNGEPTIDLLPFDVRRFLDIHNNRGFLRERVREVVGKQYSILYPLQTEFRNARKLRCSPLYSELESRGAVFGTRMGFERPLYYQLNHQLGDPPAELPLNGDFGKPAFFDSLQAEYQACREGVGIVDMSSFTKFEIKSCGFEALRFLQRLCSNVVDLPLGSIIHTGMQNERGGYVNDCVLVRMKENCFFMLSPTNQQTRIHEWLRRHLPTDNTVSLSDVTSMYTILNIIGPKSRELLTELSDTDLNLPSFTCRQVSLGYAPEVMAMSFTNTGEPGYTLCIPSEYALHVYDRLIKTGRDYGVYNVGYLTLRFLRIEKFIPFWADELDSSTTPFEVGRGWKVKLDQNDFIGRAALREQKKLGVRKRLVQLTLVDHDPLTQLWPWGGEPIYRDEKYVGSTTSSGYGYTLGKMLCLGFVTNPDPETGDLREVDATYITNKNANFEIDIAGERFEVKAALHPPSIPIIQMEGPDVRYKPKVRESLLRNKN